MLTVEALREARRSRYRQRPHLRLRDETQALEFLNDVGLCLLFSAKDIELPTLWGAICGDDRPLPGTNRDHNLGLAWDWKDRLPIAGKVLYGKFLRQKPVFVSLELAPYFYALSPNYGNLAEDYVQDYEDGRLSVEAKQVYEVLLDQGALPTSRLRREAGLAGKENAGRFDRALAELQMDLRIAKVSISDANRWGYCYVYDLLPRHFAGVVEASAQIGGSQARAKILLSYVRTVVATTPSQVARLFDWQPGDVERAVARLAAQEGLQSGVQIAGLPGEHIDSVEP
mgnify:CR=1 FL=1